MNRKMTTNSQLLTTEPEKTPQTKQITGTRTESQKWRSHGELSVEGRGWRMGEKEQGIRSINCRYKRVQEIEKPKNLHV